MVDIFSGIIKALIVTGIPKQHGVAFQSFLKGDKITKSSNSMFSSTGFIEKFILLKFRIL
jgi:hypothetical protein